MGASSRSYLSISVSPLRFTFSSVSHVVDLWQGIAWIAGYVAGDFTITFYGWLVGLGISLVVRL